MGRLLLFIVVIFTSFPGMLGCQNPVTEDEEAHHIAEHLPDDFDQALTRIEQLVAHLQHGVPLETKPTEVNPETELRDMVRWLPELAAQSDLKENDWNAVDNATRGLLDTFAKSKVPPEQLIKQGEMLAEIAKLPNLLADVRQRFREMQIPEIVSADEHESHP